MHDHDELFHPICGATEEVTPGGYWRAEATFRFWTVDAGQLAPDRLWPEAERRISAAQD